MSIFGDVWNAVSGGVSDAADVVKSLPGGSVAASAFDSAIKGPLKDFANTSTGQAVLRAIATTIYLQTGGALYWASVPFGAQLASVAFAIPGLLRGDDFDRAWLSEFKWRAEQTANIVGPGILDTFGGQIIDTLKKLADDFGVGAYVELGVRELAKRYNIREDVAGLVLALWNKIPVPSRNDFIPDTGRLTDAAAKRVYDALDPCVANTRAAADGMPGSLVAAYFDACFKKGFAFKPGAGDATFRGASLFGPPRAAGKVKTTTIGPARTPCEQYQSAVANGQGGAILAALKKKCDASSVAVASTGGATSSRSTSGSDIALAVTIVAAAGALLWWESKQ